MKHGGADHRAALDMLAAFGSVGAQAFDVTWTDQAGAKAMFRKGKTLAELTRAMPAMLDEAIAAGRNLIVRPYGPPAVFLQLDDLDAGRLAHVTPAAFLTLATSPGSHQAWLALSAAPADPDLARRVRKGTGADATASGATRVAGSLNFKDRHAPDFPRVAILTVAPGKTTTPEELAGFGLVAPAEKPPPRVSSSARWTRERRWPDYQRCLDGAPANSAGDGPDVSRADFTYAMTAADWGWGIDDVVARLMEISRKAQENGDRYARLTAANGAAAAARNRHHAGATRPHP